MDVIDSHHHLWAPVSDPAGLRYGWLRDIGAMKPFGDPTPIQRDYLLAEYLGEPAPHRITGSVHLQCDPGLPDPVAETAFIQKMCDAAGHRVAIVGFADLASEQFEDQIAGHMAHTGLRGIRQIVSHLPDRPEISFAKRDLLGDLVWQARLAELADHGLRFDLQLYPEQMVQAAEVLARVPQVPVVVDHLGSPYDTSPEGLATWHAGMAALAALPHVQVKLGGYAMFFRSDLGPVARDLTQAAVGMFGPERAMFASNFPVDRLHLRYADVVDFVADAVGAEAQDAVFRQTATAFYGL